MALAQQCDEHSRHCLVLADDRLGDLGAHTGERLTNRVRLRLRGLPVDGCRSLLRDRFLGPRRGRRLRRDRFLGIRGVRGQLGHGISLSIWVS